MRVFLFILFLIPIQLIAAPLIVDGPGDGDGDGTDNYDTVREALIALGPAGSDGVSDEIHIMVDALTEATGWIINGTPVSVEVTHGPTSGEVYWPLHDSITIRGDADTNGTRCVMDISTGSGVLDFGALITIKITDNQTFAMRDMVLMPTYRSGGSDLTIPFFLVDQGVSGVPLVGATVSFENVMVTASLFDNTPQAPGDFSTGGTAISDGQFGVVVFGVFTPVEDAGYSFTFNGCDFVHQEATVFDVRIGSGRFEMRDSQIVNNGFFGGSQYIRGTGLIVEVEEECDFLFDNLTVENNLGDGISLDPGPRGSLTVGPGSRFSFNNGHGISFGHIPPEHSGLFLGTNEEPVEANGNGRTGVTGRLLTDSHLVFDNLISTENINWGVSLNCLGSPASPVVFRDCLFEGNRPSGNLFLFSDEPVSAEFTFERCTFHDVQPPAPGGSGKHVLVNWLDGNSLASLWFANCLFSGTSDEYAVGMSTFQHPHNKRATLTNCSVVLDGPYAMAGVSSNPSAEIHLENVIFIDPQYVNVNIPTDEDSFDVRQPLYATAGPASGPLTGWGDFVADMSGRTGLELH